MNTPLTAEDEIFDDLHSGVAALQELARTDSVPLTPAAAESLQRLGAKGRLHRLKEALKANASRAAGN